MLGSLQLPDAGAGAGGVVGDDGVDPPELDPPELDEPASH